MARNQKPKSRRNKRNLKPEKERDGKQDQETINDKKEKPKTTKKTEDDKDVDAAPVQQGEGKGKDCKGKKEQKPPLTKEQKAKLPSVFFA